MSRASLSHCKTPTIRKTPTLKQKTTAPRKANKAQQKTLFQEFLHKSFPQLSSYNLYYKTLISVCFKIVKPAKPNWFTLCSCCFYFTFSHFLFVFIKQDLVSLEERISCFSGKRVRKTKSNLMLQRQ